MSFLHSIIFMSPLFESNNLNQKYISKQYPMPNPQSTRSDHASTGCIIDIQNQHAIVPVTVTQRIIEFQDVRCHEIH